MIEEKEITLTPSQSVAAEGILEWLRTGFQRTDKATHTAILAGSAGTGKTFLLNYIIERYGANGVALAAPNHRAAAQMTESTGLTAVTDHSLLALQPRFELAEFDPMNPDFGRKGMSKLEDEYIRVVIQDEASMLPPNFQKMLEDECYRLGIQILYVGDLLQLPPIVRKTVKTDPYGNKIYDEPELILSGCFDGPNMFELTDIVRQDMDNPNLFLLSCLRVEMQPTEKNIAFLYEVAETIGGRFTAAAKNVVNNPHNVVYRMAAAIKNGKLVIPERAAEAGQLFLIDTKEKQKAIANDLFKKEVYHPSGTRYIAFRNKAIENFNNHCNVRLNNYGIDDNFHTGDYFTGYRTIMRSSQKIIVNSVDYEITSVSDRYTNSHGFTGVSVEANPINANFMPTQFFSLDVDQYGQYWAKLSRLLEDAKARRGKAWGRYYGFRDAHTTRRNIVTSKGKVLDKKDLDHGYGITCHKSQGMTLENVFIDLKDFSIVKNPNLLNRLLYVGLSRSRKKQLFANVENFRNHELPKNPNGNFANLALVLRYSYPVPEND